MRAASRAAEFLHTCQGKKVTPSQH